MQTAKILLEVGQPEPKNSLVLSIPRQDGTKLFEASELASYSWEDMSGLSWTILEKW